MVCGDVVWDWYHSLEWLAGGGFTLRHVSAGQPNQIAPLLAATRCRLPRAQTLRIDRSGRIPFPAAAACTTGEERAEEVDGGLAGDRRRERRGKR